MARLVGVDLPNKHLNVALTYIFGIGRSSAEKICVKAKLDPMRMSNDLTQEELNELRQIIEGEYKVEGRLRTEVALNIKRLMDIGCYRGLRIVRVCRFAVNAQEQTLVRARVKRKPLPERRNNGGVSGYRC